MTNTWHDSQTSYMGTHLQITIDLYLFYDKLCFRVSAIYLLAL